MAITLQPEELVALSQEISSDLEGITAMADRLKLMQRSIVKWYCMLEGGTVREVAELFGIPKSTLHNWAAQDGGWGWSK